jgi:hypothetical protein
MRNFQSKADSKTLLTEYNSIMDLAEYAEHHKNKRYSVQKEGDRDSNPEASLGSRGSMDSITTLMANIRTNGGDFPAWAKEIDRLATEVAGDNSIPLGMTVRRKKKWGSHGGSINIHRVNQGRVNRAWRQVEKRELSMSQGNVVSIVIPTAFNSGVTNEQCKWAMAASLALVTLLENKGLRCHIVGFGVARSTWRKGTCVVDKEMSDNVWLIHLKQPSEPWNVNNCIALMHDGILRRFWFRFVETHGCPDWGYGQAPGGGKAYSEMIAKFFSEFGVPRNQNTIETPIPSHNISSYKDARDWVKNQIEQFELAHMTSKVG